MEISKSTIYELIKLIECKQSNIEKQKQKIEDIKREFGYEPIYEQKVLKRLHAQMYSLQKQLYKTMTGLAHPMND